MSVPVRGGLRFSTGVCGCCVCLRGCKQLPGVEQRAWQTGTSLCSQLVALPVVRFALLDRGEGLPWCFSVPLAESRISFSSFPIVFYWRWLTTACLVFSQLLAWLFTVMIYHRGAGELNTAWPERRADWPEDMAFLACWAVRSFFPHLSASHQPSEGMDWACFLISRHNLSLLLIRGHCQDTAASTAPCECREVEKDPRQEAVILYLLDCPEAIRAPPYASPCL